VDDFEDGLAVGEEAGLAPTPLIREAAVFVRSVTYCESFHSALSALSLIVSGISLSALLSTIEKTLCLEFCPLICES
jgi:hypothetical protein